VKNAEGIEVITRLSESVSNGKPVRMICIAQIVGRANIGEGLRLLRGIKIHMRSRKLRHVSTNRRIQSLHLLVYETILSGG
jgi:hypothetical protein